MVTATSKSELFIQLFEAKHIQMSQTAHTLSNKSFQQRHRLSEPGLYLLTTKPMINRIEELEDDIPDPGETIVVLKAFVTRRNVIALTVEKSRKAIPSIMTEFNSNIFRDVIGDFLPVAITSAKELMKALISILIEEVLIDVVQHGRLEILLKHYVNESSATARVMD